MDLNSVNWRKSSYSASNGGDCVEVGAAWWKSSYSRSNGGNCVEVGLGWHKSSRSSSDGACVEVARHVPAAVVVRDSKDAGGPVLAFSAEDWQAFTTRIKSGDLSPG